MARVQVQDAAQTMVRRAKKTAEFVRHEGRVAAAQLGAKATEFADRKDVRQAVKRAGKTVARARTNASALALKASVALAGRPKPSRAKRGAKVAMAVAGVAAVAAVGVTVARRRK